MQEPTRRRQFRCTVPPLQRGERLDLLVLAWLSRELGGAPISKAFVRKLVMAGAIRVDGRPMRRPGAIVEAGSQLEASVDLASLRHVPARDGRDDGSATLLAPPTVLYEDDDLIAVAKPARLPAHATADARRPDLFSLVRRLLAARPARGRDVRPLPYLGLHHRLDVDTSGVMLFTKREAANAGLARQFAEGTVEKVYHALTARAGGTAAGAGWRVDNRLARDGTGRRSRMTPVGEGGVRAVTSFRIVRASRAAYLVEARPETGRTHQVRAHLAAGGLPILGDLRYGGPQRLGTCTAARVMLHARRLELVHPITGTRLSIDAPYPADFAGALACLFPGGAVTISGR